MTDGADHLNQKAAAHLGLLHEQRPEFRLRRDEPLSGYWALMLEGSGATLHLHVQNLRPLAAENAFVYQAWLVPAAGDRAALPPFNTSPDGAGFCTIRARTEDVALGTGAQLVVTAEPRHPQDDPSPAVLAGIWAVIAPTSPAQAMPTSSAQAAPAGQSMAAGPNTPASPNTPAGQSLASPTAPAAALGQDGAAPGAGNAAGAELPPGGDLFLHQTPPATPVLAVPPGYEPLEQTQEALTPVKDLAKSGNGLAVFDFPRDMIVISLDDVPTPDAFGSDPITARPFNVYAGWLARSKDLNDLVPLGFFRRAGAGAYRLQARGAAPLASYDTVIVSAEDRASAFDPVERQVFSAPYSAFAPAGTPPQQI